MGRINFSFFVGFSAIFIHQMIVSKNINYIINYVAFALNCFLSIHQNLEIKKKEICSN
jgi:hypothetical protein